MGNLSKCCKGSDFQLSPLTDSASLQVVGGFGSAMLRKSRDTNLTLHRGTARSGLPLPARALVCASITLVCKERKRGILKKAQVLNTFTCLKLLEKGMKRIFKKRNLFAYFA